ncbi:hypothetical protein BsWGS_13239 [Bradybaena similaris]
MVHFTPCMIALPVACITFWSPPITVGADYGDLCTKNDTSNCTQPQETCLPSLTCGCSVGFIEDTTGPNGTVCRLPRYNESCTTTWGCQPNLQCLNTSTSWVCQCDQAVDYYSSDANQCVDKPIYGESCNVTIGCEVWNQCSGVPPTCQCNSSTVYFDSTMYQCMPMSDLKVNVLSTVISPTTITITWEEQDPDVGVFYRIHWLPSDGHLDYLGQDGGQLSGLHPATVYVLTVASVLPADPYFPEKHVSVTLDPIQTMALRDLTDSSQLELAVGLGVAGFVVAATVVCAVVFIRRKRRSRERIVSQSAGVHSNGQEGQCCQSKEIPSGTETRDVKLQEQTTYGAILPTYNEPGSADIPLSVNNGFETRDKTQLLVQ